MSFPRFGFKVSYGPWCEKDGEGKGEGQANDDSGEIFAAIIYVYVTCKMFQLWS